MEKLVPVFIIDAARTPTVKYEPGDFRTMTELLAEPVRHLDARLLQSVDTVYATYRYPMPFEQRFDADHFIEEAKLPSAEVLRFRIDPLGMLGGLGVVDEIVRELSAGERSTVLVVGGEVFEPSVADHLLRRSQEPGWPPDEFDEFDRRKRRRLLSKYGGLSAQDREVGFTPATAHALVADAMFRENRLSKQEMSDLFREISCHLEKYACINKNSYQRNRKEGRSLERITPERYRAKEERDKKWPFTLFDICGIVNSSAALLLTNNPPSSLRQKVLVAESIINRRGGIGGLLGRDILHRLTSNLEAWHEIAGRLGVSFARSDVVSPGPRLVLELVDTFAYQIPMTLIDMGMYDDLRSILTDFRRGFFDPAPDDDMPRRVKNISPSCGIVLNPSGGSRDGTPHSAYGLVRAAECFNLLTGLSGDRLLPPGQLDFAFVHAMSLANTTGVLALKAC